MPDQPRPIVESAPSPPLTRKPPESPLKKPPNKPKILCSNSLDTQLPSQYIHNTQKRVLIKSFLSVNFVRPGSRVQTLPFFSERGIKRGFSQTPFEILGIPEVVSFALSSTAGSNLQDPKEQGYPTRVHQEQLVLDKR
jgi:hypothetical protein